MEKRRRKTPFQAGVIDVGAHSVRLDIFEISPDGKITLLEHLTRNINLGRDVFRYGEVSPEMLAILTNIMSDFAEKCAEYKLLELRALATSAIREAFNRDLVINRIYNHSGIKLEILEFQEDIKIMFSAIRDIVGEKLNFSKLNGITISLGTGSLLWSYFEKGVMRFCEEIPLGTVRLKDTVGGSYSNINYLLEVINTHDIASRLEECAQLKDNKNLTLIATGASVRLLTQMVQKEKDDSFIEVSANDIRKRADYVITMPPATLANKLAVSEDVAATVCACGGIMSHFFEELPIKQFICPGITTRSAVIHDLAKKKLKIDNDFHKDVISVCRSIGKKYAFDEGHAENVCTIALTFFNKLKRHFGFNERTKVLLELSAYLHDIGRFIDTKQHHKHSFYLLNNMSIPGITPKEQNIIAAIARYHRKTIPKASHKEYMMLSPEDKVTVLKMAAILRVSDSLDCSRSGKLKNIKLTLHGHNITILSKENSDKTSERIQLKLKSDLFNSVFGMELKLDSTT